MDNRSFIFSDTLGNVNGALVGIDIEVTQDLLVSNGSRITAENDFSTTGRAGDVRIRAGSVEVTGFAIVNSQLRSSLIGSRLFPGSTGDGGDVVITTGSLKVTNQGKISTENGGSGQPGNLIITADSIEISDGGSITSTTSGDGGGGAIALGAQQVQLTASASISAQSIGTGDAGNIFIQAGDSFVSRNSAVTTEAAQADGGNIEFHVGRLFHLVNSEITTSVGGGAGNGGNITIDPQFVILDSSRIIASAIGGNGGNITIVAGVFLASPDSLLDASSSLGISGTISIQAPLSNLSGALAPLPQEFLQVASLLSARCAARLSGKTSSFVLAGRDGLPPAPGGMQPSPLVRARAGGALSAQTGRKALESYLPTLEARLVEREQESLLSERGCGR